jgi:hypothetical protein
MVQRAQASRVVPSIVTKGLYGTAAATALKNTYKQTRKRGGKTKKTKQIYKKRKKENKWYYKSNIYKKKFKKTICKIKR